MAQDEQRNITEEQGNKKASSVEGAFFVRSIYTQVCPRQGIRDFPGWASPISIRMRFLSEAGLAKSHTAFYCTADSNTL